MIVREPPSSVGKGESRDLDAALSCLGFGGPRPLPLEEALFLSPAPMLLRGGGFESSCLTGGVSPA